MPFSRQILTPLVLAVVVVLSACGGDSDSPAAPPAPPPSDDLTPVVGSWLADSIVVSPKANPSEAVEIVSRDGVQLTFTVQSSGAYRAVLRAFGSQSEETGTIRLQGGQIFFSVQTPVVSSASGQWSRTGGRLILESDDLPLDFNRDGILDDVHQRLVFSSL
jgi:hypothetical protein